MDIATKLPRRVPYEKINRGYFYLAAIPYANGRPLNFFEPCDQCEDFIDCAPSKIAFCGKSVSKHDGFEGKVNAGKREAQELGVIVPHKVRLAIVLQNNRYNHSTHYHHVYVAPIASLRPEEKNETYIKELINNKIAHLHFIGTHTGREAYVNLADVKRIHKSLLLELKEYAPLNQAVMTEMCKKIASLLDIREISACEDCQRRCEKCELKRAAVNQD